MKKIYKFSAEVASATNQTVQFKEIEGGVEFDLVFFSTAWNRNKAYFQVSDLLRWSNKPEKLLANFNHNLAESGGKYLGNQTRVVSLAGRYNEGSYEIYGTVRSTDPAVIARKYEITAPSIELEVDSDDVKEFVDGSGAYFTDYEWVGYALLTGIMAGSGDTRVTDIREFSNQSINQTINNNMSKEELLAFFQSEEGKATIKAIFEGEPVEGAVEAETVTAEEMKAFLATDDFKQAVKASFEEVEQPEQPADNSEPDETEEQKQNRIAYEAQILEVEKQAKAKAKIATFEQVPEAGEPAEEATVVENKAQQVPSFYSKLQQ